MPVPFSSEDLGRIFDARTLTKGRSLILLGAVEVTVNDRSIAAVVEHVGFRRTVTITPSLLGQRVMFMNNCSCGHTACLHLAAASLAALDRFPELRRPVQSSLLDMLTATPAEERQALWFELGPGQPPHACFVSTVLIGNRTGRRSPTTPADILKDPAGPDSNRVMARLLGGVSESRCPVAPNAVSSVLGLLARIGRGRWHATGKTLSLGEERSFPANVPPDLPPRSTVILGESGPWYVDGATGAVGRVRLRRGDVAERRTPQAPGPQLPIHGRPERAPAPIRAPYPPPQWPVFSGHRNSPPRRAAPIVAQPEPVILERPLTPVLRLRTMETPDDFGRMQRIDALTVDFDYDGVLVLPEDERQFVRIRRPGETAASASFVRRDREGEAAALAILRQDGFNQMRIVAGATAKGRVVYVYRGRDAAERWQAFIAERVRALQALGWRNEIDKDFGPRTVQSVGDYDVRVSDAESGRFSLDFGIEVDGARIPLVPILSRLLERGGMETAQIVDGKLITSLEDGRLLRLPAERISRLLAVMSDLLDAAHRTAEGKLLLPDSEAIAVLELEDLLTTRWHDAGAISSYAERFRGAAALPPITVPASFTATLRPYQLQGVAWLLRGDQGEKGRQSG